MDVIAWLLDSDPAIRWQVMRDLQGSPAQDVARERARVATEGWGAQLLALQGPRGHWGIEALDGVERPASGLPPGRVRRLLRELHGIPLEDLGPYIGVEPETLAAWEAGEPDPADERSRRYTAMVDWMWNIGANNPTYTATAPTLVLLHDMGLDPDSPQAQRALALVRDNVKWENAGQDFFAGEVEPCINGRTVATGAYFGQGVDGIVERLLGEQLEDGGWNCEAERGSVRSSFHTTIAVLEGFLEYERRTGSAEVRASSARAREYLLDRGLMRALSTGEIIDERWTRFAYPPRWHYDVLRGLDHLRNAGVTPDHRIDEALDVVEGRRQPDGRWLLDTDYEGKVHFPLDEGVGKPSRWITLKAARVLTWAGRGSLAAAA